MSENWRLALIVDDHEAMKVAAAYYSLPKAARSDIDRIATLSGVYQGASEVVDRLTVAGVLGHQAPPDELKILLNAYCDRAVTQRR